jgi:cAMP phosphodiesterase
VAAAVKLRVLGCHGGETSEHRATGFLIDGALAVDAGSITSTLSLAEQRVIRHVLVSHCHLDHVKDLAPLADNVLGSPGLPVEVIGLSDTLAALREHFFNDRMWPDFTKIPTPEDPVYRLRPIGPGRPIRVGGYAVRAVPVAHPVASSAFVIRDRAGSAIAFSSDTGPTDLLWRALARTARLRAVFVELSLPDRMRALADAIGHLTPATVGSELAKLGRDVPVYLYHLKPAYADEIAAELAARRAPWHLLRRGDVFCF